MQIKDTEGGGFMLAAISVRDGGRLRAWLDGGVADGVFACEDHPRELFVGMEECGVGNGNLLIYERERETLFNLFWADPLGLFG